MASEDDTPPEATDQICMPCRGTGRLISGLGGTSHEVTCPWCQGSGRRIAGVNAQEHPAEDGPAGSGEPSPSSSTP